MRASDGRHYEVCDRVVIEPGVGRKTVLLAKPARGSLMETWGIGRLRIQLDRGDVLYAEPDAVRHLDVIEALSEVDRA